MAAAPSKGDEVQAGDRPPAPSHGQRGLFRSVGISSFTMSAFDAAPFAGGYIYRWRCLPCARGGTTWTPLGSTWRVCASDRWGESRFARSTDGMWPPPPPPPALPVSFMIPLHKLSNFDFKWFCPQNVGAVVGGVWRGVRGFGFCLVPVC